MHLEGDYQKYMSQYASQYQNYMQGASGNGGDGYQKYYKKCLWLFFEPLNNPIAVEGHCSLFARQSPSQKAKQPRVRWICNPNPRDARHQTHPQPLNPDRPTFFFGDFV